jgi:hypothetical protein
MSEPVWRTVRGKKRKVVEKPIVIVNYMENMGRMDAAIHSNILLPLQDTEMGAKIIILGYGSFSNRCIHPVWKVARKTTAFQ